MFAAFGVSDIAFYQHFRTTWKMNDVEYRMIFHHSMGKMVFTTNNTLSHYIDRFSQYYYFIKCLPGPIQIFHFAEAHNKTNNGNIYFFMYSFAPRLHKSWILKFGANRMKCVPCTLYSEHCVYDLMVLFSSLSKWFSRLTRTVYYDPSRRTSINDDKRQNQTFKIEPPVRCSQTTFHFLIYSLPALCVVMVIAFTSLNNFLLHIVTEIMRWKECQEQTFISYARCWTFEWNKN